MGRKKGKSRGKKGMINDQKHLKKKKKSENKLPDIMTEVEYDAYMAGIYGLEYVAGYTSDGVPYGVPLKSEEEDDYLVKVIHRCIYDEEGIPF